MHGRRPIPWGHGTLSLADMPTQQDNIHVVPGFFTSVHTSSRGKRTRKLRLVKTIRCAALVEDTMHSAVVCLMQRAGPHLAGVDGDPALLALAHGGRRGGAALYQVWDGLHLPVDERAYIGARVRAPQQDGARPARPHHLRGATRMRLSSARQPPAVFYLHLVGHHHCHGWMSRARQHTPAHNGGQR